MWMREAQELAAMDLTGGTKLAVTWIDPRPSDTRGEAFSTLRFANAARASKAERTVKEIAQVREFEASTNQGM